MIHYSTSHANFSRESVGLETAIYLCHNRSYSVAAASEAVPRRVNFGGDKVQVPATASPGELVPVTAV
ncbi:MAG: hypothetical protein ABSA30_10565, partial [Candidatus Aminicenantales bacterium]